MSARRLAGFSLLAVATGGINIPIQIYLPAFYATVIGLDLATVGSIFMVGRLVSVALDPVFGWASDRTLTSIGRRKPWILAGGAICQCGLLALFFPAANAGRLYLAATLLATCLGWIACSTPHYAWGGELARTPASVAASRPISRPALRWASSSCCSYRRCSTVSAAAIPNGAWGRWAPYWR